MSNLDQNQRLGISIGTFGLLLAGSLAAWSTDPLAKQMGEQSSSVANATPSAHEQFISGLEEELGGSDATQESDDAETTAMKPVVDSLDSETDPDVPPSISSAEDLATTDDISDLDIEPDSDAVSTVSDDLSADAADDLGGDSDLELDKPQNTDLADNPDDLTATPEDTADDLLAPSTDLASPADIAASDPIAADPNPAVDDLLLDDASDSQLPSTDALASEDDLPSNPLPTDLVPPPSAIDDLAGDTPIDDVADAIADAPASNVGDSPSVVDPAPADAPVTDELAGPVAAETFGDSSVPSEVPATDDLAGDPVAAEPPAIDDSADPVAADAPTTGNIAADPVAAEPPAGDDLVVSSDDDSPGDPAPAEPPATTEATPAAKPFLGVGIRNVQTTTVTTLHGRSTAEKLGVKVGDQLQSVNGVELKNFKQLVEILKTMSVGDEITLVVRRRGQLYRLGPVGLLSKT